MTARTIMVALSHEFAAYLDDTSCGLFLPPSVNEELDARRAHEEFGNLDDEDKYCSGDDAESGQGSVVPRLDEEIEIIRQGIVELGGTITPYLNWHSPNDARWVNIGGTVCCSTPADVILLLKSSDRISDDLARCRELGVPPMLCLRQFLGRINFQEEIRVFVRNSFVVAVASKRMPLDDVLLDRAVTFVFDHVIPKFSLPSFAVDVCGDKVMKFLPWNDVRLIWPFSAEQLATIEVSLPSSIESMCILKGSMQYTTENNIMLPDVAGRVSFYPVDWEEMNTADMIALARRRDEDVASADDSSANH